MEQVAQGNPEEDFAREEARLELARILDELPDDQRLVFLLYELEERTCPDIALALSVPLGTVHTRLRSARAAFEEKARRRRAL